MLVNRTIGERCHDALLEHAERKVDAIRARKLADRIYDRVFLTIDGKNLEEKKCRARLDEKFIVAEDAAIEAESLAVISKAKADGLQIEFESWRSKQATDRAEMQMR